MKKLIILFVLSSVSVKVICQSVYDDQTEFIFKGNICFPKIVVLKDEEQIKYTLLDKSNKIIKNENIPFSNLPLGRYLKFYNSIGFLSGSNGNYLYDFISKKRFPYDGEYDRYNEEIQLGKYNPLLKTNNLLLIIDDKLSVYRTIQLNIKPNSKEYWLLTSEGSDVMSGKIRLLKCIKQGRSTSENTYNEYIYDATTNKLNFKR